jgi:hypothetical protein
LEKFASARKPAFAPIDVEKEVMIISIGEPRKWKRIAALLASLAALILAIVYALFG